MRGFDNQMKGKKLKVLIGIIVVVIVAVIFGINIRKNNSNKDISENYILIKQDNKYGVIDKQGNIVINPQYDMIQIPNPEKAVFVCLYDYDAQSMEYKSKVLNQSAQQIFTTFDNVNAIQIKNNTEKYPYQTQILEYKNGDKYGLISIEGKKITDAIYDEIESIAYKIDCVAVKQNDKYGVVDKTGKTIVQPEYDRISSDYFSSEKSKYNYAGFIVSVTNNDGYRYGYIDYKGKVILKAEYTQIDRIPLESSEKDIYLIGYKNGQAGLLKNKKSILPFEYEYMEFNSDNNVVLVKKANKCGVVNLKGKYIIPLEYDGIDIEGNCINAEKNNATTIFDINGNIQENVDYVNISTTDSKYKIVANSEGKFGIIGEKNEKLINYSYNYIDYLFDNNFIATVDGKVGVITSANVYKINAKYDSIQKIGNNNVLQAINVNDNLVDIYNEKLELVKSFTNPNIEENDGYIKIVSEDDLIYLDKQGNIKENTEVLSKANLFASKKDGKWGFVDSSKNVKLDYKYDMVTEFNENGFAGIKSNGLWGVVNSKLEIIVEPKYKIDSVSPDFIGQYYKNDSIYGRSFYSNEVVE